jgi:hypothetical protein
MLNRPNLPPRRAFPAQGSRDPLCTSPRTAPMTLAQHPPPHTKTAHPPPQQRPPPHTAHPPQVERSAPPRRRAQRLGPRRPGRSARRRRPPLRPGQHPCSPPSSRVSRVGELARASQGCGLVPARPAPLLTPCDGAAAAAAPERVGRALPPAFPSRGDGVVTAARGRSQSRRQGAPMSAPRRLGRILALVFVVVMMLTPRDDGGGCGGRWTSPRDCYRRCRGDPFALLPPPSPTPILPFPPTAPTPANSTLQRRTAARMACGRRVDVSYIERAPFRP